MPANSAFRYYSGGPVPSDSPTYITRREENRAIRALQRSEYISVVGPRQVGKTSLLKNIAGIYDRQGYATAFLDLSTFNDPTLDWHSWVKIFCEKLVKEVRSKLDVDPPLLPPELPARLVDYLGSLSRSLKAPGLLILLDEANAIPNPVRDLFYSNIRFIHNERMRISGLQELNFAFAGVFDPERLVLQRENSPFNISSICRLKDFSVEEVRRLATCLETWLGCPVPADLVETVHAETGGQPYLTQTLLDLCQEQWQTDKSLTSEQVAGLRGDLMDLASDNINHVVRTALHGVEERRVIQRLLDGETVPFARAAETISLLELSGAIRENEVGLCAIRNPIYLESIVRTLPQTITPGEQVNAKQALAQALLACPALEKRQTRDQIVNNQMPDDISAGITRHDDNRADVFAILTRCLDFENGLELLLQAVRFYEGDSLPMRQAEQAARRFLG